MGVISHFTYPHWKSEKRLFFVLRAAKNAEEKRRLFLLSISGAFSIILFEKKFTFM